MFENNFKESLKEIIKNFSKHKESLNRYPYSSKVMCDEFYSTFLNLSSTKKN